MILLILGPQCMPSTACAYCIISEDPTTPKTHQAYFNISPSRFKLSWSFPSARSFFPPTTPPPAGRFPVAPAAAVPLGDAEASGRTRKAHPLALLPLLLPGHSADLQAPTLGRVLNGIAVSHGLSARLVTRAVEAPTLPRSAAAVVVGGAKPSASRARLERNMTATAGTAAA